MSLIPKRIYLSNIFPFFLAFSPQDFTAIFPLIGSSEPKNQLVFHFFPWVSTWRQVNLRADGCILVNHGAFSLYLLAFSMEAERLFQMAKKAQTEAKRIKPVKHKCRKWVSPADFGGFKILNWIFQGKRSGFIPFSLLGAQTFALTQPTFHVTNKHRDLCGASLAGDEEGMSVCRSHSVQRGGAGSGIASALRINLPIMAEPGWDPPSPSARAPTSCPQGHLKLNRWTSVVPWNVPKCTFLLSSFGFSSPIGCYSENEMDFLVLGGSLSRTCLCFCAWLWNRPKLVR